jgi:hypothetical protein
MEGILGKTRLGETKGSRWLANCLKLESPGERVGVFGEPRRGGD